MANFRRRRPKHEKEFSWGHRPEHDIEPDPSRITPAKSDKKKKPWVVTGDNVYGKHGRVIFGRYETEARAQQAMQSMKHSDDSMRHTIRTYPDHHYRVEYTGKEEC